MKFGLTYSKLLMGKLIALSAWCLGLGMVCIPTLANSAPHSSIRFDNIVDYTSKDANAAFNNYRPSSNDLAPLSLQSAEGEIKEPLNYNMMSPGHNASIDKKSNFCVESKKTSGTVVGSIKKQKSGETYLVVQTRSKLEYVKAPPSQEVIGSIVEVPAKNCD